MLTPYKVAEVLAITEQAAIEQGLRALLLREMTNLETEISRFRERYGVLEPENLRMELYSVGIMRPTIHLSRLFPIISIRVQRRMSSQANYLMNL
ncbi:MAG: hypothetical protein KF893_27065 [Caldilineaceae bacterium]|nr:hypothetical protein [Caldilineaceae bacterium]